MNERRWSRSGPIWVGIGAALLGVGAIVAVATLGTTVGQSASEVSTPSSTASTYPMVTQIPARSTSAPTAAESSAVIDNFMNALAQRGGMGHYDGESEVITIDYYGPEQASADEVESLAAGFAVELRFWGDRPGPQT